MTRPAFIYTPFDFAAVVQLGTTTESLFLDFKKAINTKAPDAQQETCRDIAQFANTEGGCLVIGVNEWKDQTTGIKVADSISGLPDPDQMQQWIEQAIRNYLVPATFSHDVSIIQDPRGTVIAVNIPPSRHLVALWDNRGKRPTIEYVRRTSHGKDWMNPDEVERHLMNGSRAAKLALIAAREQATSEQVEIADGIRQQSSGGPRAKNWYPDPSKLPITISQMREYWFELRMDLPPFGVVSVTIPYNLIEEAWVNSSGRVVLLLTVRIVERNGALTLEPYA